uniref:Uncharacterized protein n=1 Tax=Anopheles culicifacies TaxID=139723 RepID=A0A182ML34_9DIPT
MQTHRRSHRSKSEQMQFTDVSFIAVGEQEEEEKEEEEEQEGENGARRLERWRGCWCVLHFRSTSNLFVGRSIDDPVVCGSVTWCIVVPVCFVCPHWHTGFGP